MSDNLSLIVEFKALDAKVTSSFKKIADQNKAMQGQIAQTNKALELGPRGAIAAFTQLKGILAGIGITAVAASVADMAREISHTYDETQKLGVSIASFQQLAIVGKEAGVSQESLSMSIFKMNKTLGDAQLGGKQASDALAALGLNAKDFIGLSPDKSFIKIAKSLGEIGDIGVRTGAAVDIFGRGARDSMGLFTQDIDKAVSAIKQLGVGLSQLQGKSLDNLVDSGARAVEVLKNKLQQNLGSIAVLLQKAQAYGDQRTKSAGDAELAGLIGPLHTPAGRGQSVSSSIPGYKQGSTVDTTAAVLARLNMNKATDMASKALQKMAESSNGVLIAFNSFKTAAESFTKGKAGEYIQNAAKAANPLDAGDNAYKATFEARLAGVIQAMQGITTRVIGDTVYQGSGPKNASPNLSALEASAITPAMKEVVNQLKSQQQNIADQSKLIQELNNLKTSTGVSGNSIAQGAINQLLGSINENTDPAQLLKSIGDLKDGIKGIVGEPAKVDLQVTIKPSREFEADYKISGTGGVKQLESMLGDLARQQGRRGL